MAIRPDYKNRIKDIDKAIFATQGILPEDKDGWEITTEVYVLKALRDFEDCGVEYLRGEYSRGGTKYNPEYLEFVCTEDEYILRLSDWGYLWEEYSSINFKDFLWVSDFYETVAKNNDFDWQKSLSDKKSYIGIATEVRIEFDPPITVVSGSETHTIKTDVQGTVSIDFTQTSESDLIKWFDFRTDKEYIPKVGAVCFFNEKGFQTIRKCIVKYISEHNVILEVKGKEFCYLREDVTFYLEEK